ncbi:MAG: TRAP transporter substrate-binding protein [Anaerovoracaceae bacterium]
MKKKLIALVTMVAVMAAMVLTGCGSSGGDTDATYTMQIGHVVAEDHPSHVTLLEFEKAVEEGTDGHVQVEISANGALGGEAQLAEMLTLDSLQATVVGADAVSGLVSDFALIGAPYLFDSRTSAYAALDGDFGAALAEEAAEKNIQVVAWGDAGFRNVTNSKREIVTPDDLKGIKIRTMENDLHMGLFKLFGANPTPIAFNELFTALQQGTVDAQENPITVFTVSKFYEVQKYMTTTEHVYTAAPFLINKSWLESLPEEYQQVILDAAAAWGTSQRQAMEDGEAAHMQTCIDNGMEIYTLTPEEKQVWMEKAAGLEDQILKDYDADLYELAKSFNAN